MGGAEGEAAARQSWVTKAKAFLKRTRGETLTTEEAAPVKKKRRVKSYGIMVMLDNILKHHHNEEGLKKFQVLGDERGELPCPCTWPHLALVGDQGPDNVCSTGYMKHLDLNIEDYADPSHGAWNDGRGALREAGLWGHELMMIAAMNVAYGSTYSPPRLAQLREAATEYLTNTNPHECPVPQDNLGALLHEQGLDVRPEDPGAIEFVRAGCEGWGLSHRALAIGRNTGLFDR